MADPRLENLHFERTYTVPQGVKIGDAVKDIIGPGHRIITVEEAERQARDLLARAEAQRDADNVTPLGYIVLTQQADDTWQDDWDGKVHETRQQVLEELQRARNALGEDYARAAVLYPLEAP